MNTSFKLITLLTTLSPLSASASFQYWSSSDRCEGAPSGVIEVVGSDPAAAGCVAIGGDGRVWSIKVEGTCIDVRDATCRALFQ